MGLGESADWGKAIKKVNSNNRYKMGEMASDAGVWEVTQRM